MLKTARTPDLTITVGDNVRSYDFPFRDDCYVEGKVVAIDQGLYIIATTCQVVDSIERAAPFCREIGAPVNGSEGFLGLTAGVVRI